MSAQYSILVDVELNTANVQSQLDDISGKMKFNTNALTSAGKEVGLTYQAAYTIFSKCTEAIGSMVEQVMELDAATIELQKVSDLQGKALETYIDNLGKAGQNVARTTSEMVEAATEFRKSGFNDSDSAMLAEIAAMYQNIADTEVSASDAASSIISQLRAFGKGADYATHVIDAYNEVANNFAVGTNDISSAMEVAGSALNIYGNTFEESIGLIVAGSEQLQGKSLQVARGLITISANISSNKDLLHKYGIEVEQENGTLLSTYEVLTLLSEQWDTLSEKKQRDLAETLAGKNQTKVN